MRVIKHIATVSFIRPFSQQPKPGQRVHVFMKDGSETDADCTLIHMCAERYIQWYETKTRKAIDVNLIKGWIPAAPSANKEGS